MLQTWVRTSPVAIPSNVFLNSARISGEHSTRIFFHLIPIVPSTTPNAEPVSKCRPKPSVMTLLNPKPITMIKFPSTTSAAAITEDMHQVAIKPANAPQIAPLSVF
jgi:hypothetical protein